MERCLGKCVIHTHKYLLSSSRYLLPVFSYLLRVLLESVFVRLPVPPAAIPLGVRDSWLCKGEVSFLLDG